MMAIGKPTAMRQHEHLHDPIGCVDVFQHQVDDLQQKPGSNGVGDTHLEDVAAFEFVEKTHGCGLSFHSPMWSWVLCWRRISINSAKPGCCQKASQSGSSETSSGR